MKITLHQDGSDPLTWETVEVSCPEGYGVIYTGRLKEGDLCLDCEEVRNKVDGKPVVVWDPVEIPTEKEVRDNEPYSRVHWFGAIIRPGVESQKACERCGTEGRERKSRFCDLCGVIVLSEQKSRSLSNPSSLT